MYSTSFSFHLPIYIYLEHFFIYVLHFKKCNFLIDRHLGKSQFFFFAYISNVAIKILDCIIGIVCESSYKIICRNGLLGQCLYALNFWYILQNFNEVVTLNILISSFWEYLFPYTLLNINLCFNSCQSNQWKVVFHCISLWDALKVWNVTFIIT